MGDVVRRRLSVHCRTSFASWALRGISRGPDHVLRLGCRGVRHQKGSTPAFLGSRFQAMNDKARAIRAELLRQCPWRLEISDRSLMFARFSDENSENPLVEVFTRFEMAPAAQGQNAGRSSPAECQP